MLCAVLALAPPSAASIFDASVRAHAEMRQADVSFSWSLKNRTSTSQASGRLRYSRPDRLRIDLTAPAQGGLAATKALWDVNRDQVTLMDVDGREVAIQKLRNPVPASLADRLSLSVGTLEWPIRVMSDPIALEGFYAGYRKLTDFRVTVGTSLITMTRRTSQGAATFVFDPQRRLRSVDLTIPGGTLAWRFSYRTPAAIPGLNLAGYRRVGALMPRTAPPKFADATARQAFERAHRAYRSAVGFLAAVVEDGEEQTIWRSGGKYRQRNPGSEWAYDGQNLTVVDRRSRKAWRGRVRATQVPATLATLRVDANPILTSLLRGQNPMDTLGGTGARGRRIGRMQVGTATADLIELSRSDLRVNVAVRTQDGLIVSTVGETRDPSGQVLVRTERRYRYLQVGGLTGNDFVVRLDGLRPSPLPARR